MATLSQSCRATLYRALCERPGAVSGVFFHASTREEAWAELHVAMARLFNRQADDCLFCRVDSYEELVDAGVSSDRDFRIFEIRRQGAVITGWVTRPVFLKCDSSLLSKWAELKTQFAAERPVSIRNTHRRSRAMPPH